MTSQIVPVTPDDVILELQDVKKHFPVQKGWGGREKSSVKAVDGVNLTVRRGETLGIVGESGCGKSTMARLAIRLLQPSSGSIRFDGQEISDLKSHELRSIRKDMQMIFQDPYASLNPRWTVERTLLEPMRVYGIGNKEEQKARVIELLDHVGLNRSYAKRFPHEFSGGQRQRIGIARAMVLKPKLIIADEPVSALDISIQAQVINLLRELQDAFQLTYVFISHDLSVVEHISDRVAVMYLGRVVELAEKDKLFADPKHPYSVALMSAVPEVYADEKKQRVILRGDVPSPANPPSGCAFHTRCAHCMELCKTERPVLQEVVPGQQVACHLY